jgi:hypothetical protein
MKLVSAAEGVINNTALIELFINDLCRNSSPAEGLHLSHEYHSLLVKGKEFNYRVYLQSIRVCCIIRLRKCIIVTIFRFLDSLYGASLYGDCDGQPD